MNQSTVIDVAFETGTASHKGLVRRNNEDAYSIFQAWLQAEHAPEGRRLVQVAVVADGVGGSAAGERASHLAVEIIERVMIEDSGSPVKERLERAIQQANSRLFELPAKHPELKGMGTTVVAAAIVDDQLYVAHAGDSRAYLIRDGKAHLLTKDHTWAQEAMDAGYLTPQEAARHPNRHVIKRFLGVTSQVEVDHWVRAPAVDGPEESAGGRRPTVDALLFRPGDTLLLCTDGLTDVVDEETIPSAVGRSQPQEAAARLVDLANQAGGPDNTTVVLVRWPGAKGKSKGNAVRLALLAAASAVLLILLLEMFNPGLIDAAMLDSLRGFLPDVLGVQTPLVTTDQPVGTVLPSSILQAAALQTPVPASVPASAPLTGASGISTVTSTGTLYGMSTMQATVQAPLPTSTLPISPTSTPVPSPTPAPRTSTPTNSPALTAEPIAYPTIELVYPKADDTIEKLPVVFQWQFGDNCLPLEKEGFEVRAWAEGQPPGGIMDAQTQQHQINCKDGLYQFPIQNFESILHGPSAVLYWNVHLVKIEPTYVLTPLVETAPVKFNMGGN